METRNCQNCKNDFVIEPDDFSFYEKIKVPLPTWCPECRMTRRLAFGNAWGVHFRNCDKCGKKTLTMYRPDNKVKVFCDPCWWADDWDGTEYAMDYDPNRNFLEQWRELRDRTPHFAKDALYITLKNCEYTNAIAFSKDCYMSFWADYCEFVYYSAFLTKIKDSIDIFRAFNSNLCYESVGIGNCNRTYFSNECDSCVDVWFSRNCYNCLNCFGCVNQRGKTYMIFNEQYSREDYLKKLEELKINTRTGIEKSYEKAIALWNSLPYREYTGNSRNLNVSGDYLYESKNAKHCYMCSGVEDSKYTQFVSVPKATNCYDYYGWGNSADLIYECATSGEGVSSLKFSFGMFANGLDSEYCGWCIGTKNNFGCVNLKRKQYAILNKIYSKEEYEVLKEKIIKDMKENPYKDSKGRVYPYGEFFPPEFSLFPYNDSNANKFIEKDKEQALREGYNWQDKVENSYQKTIKGNNLPETIDETTNDILNEIIECADCERGYRITEGELSLYRRLDIPVPSKCPKCREARRFSLINKPRFYESECNKCGKKIKTMYDPSQGKIVYCESCYQQEMN
jgi:CxxC-x17-CxxC domain-containing protein